MSGSAGLSGAAGWRAAGLGGAAGWKVEGRSTGKAEGRRPEGPGAAGLGRGAN